MPIDLAVVVTSRQTRAAADRSSADCQCDSVFGTHGFTVQSATQGALELECGLRSAPTAAPRSHLAPKSRPLAAIDAKGG